MLVLLVFKKWTHIKKFDLHLILENNLIHEFNLLLKNEENFWKLKSRV